MYKKIYRTVISLSLISAIMTAILILTVCYTALNLKNVNIVIFKWILVGSGLCTLLVYGLTVIFARNLTANIIKPIENLGLMNDDGKGIYPELIPVIKRISGQNAEINHQINKVNQQRVRLQAVGENMNEGLVVLDSNTEIISANNAAVSIFGGKELLHRLFSEVTNDTQLINCLNSVMNGSKISTIVEFNDIKYRAFFSPVIENNKVNGAVVLVFDINEEMKTVEIRREFSANVSHELKTPLTTIRGYSQLINNGIAKNEDIITFTKKIEHESSRMIALIDDIIKISKLDEGAEKEEHIPVKLADVVNETVETLSERAKERNIELIVKGEGGVVYGNQGQISEMIYNLCDNAIKYNIDNGKVTVELFVNGFDVSDTGIGIPENMQERIFERFFRVDKSRSKKVSGTGLGLSIVKHIALCHDAEISVKSTLGKGSCFSVRFSLK